MRCPIDGCDGQLRVINTTARPNHVRRSRRCDTCSYRTVTSEFSTPVHRPHLDDAVVCGVLAGITQGVRPTVLAKRWDLPIRRVLQLRDDWLKAQGENARLASQELATPPDPA